jgi:hypothetical protein
MNFEFLARGSYPNPEIKVKSIRIRSGTKVKSIKRLDPQHGLRGACLLIRFLPFQIF